MSYCGRYLGLFAGGWLGLVSSTSRSDGLPPPAAGMKYPHVQTVIHYPGLERTEPEEAPAEIAEAPQATVQSVNEAVILAMLMDEMDYYS